MMKYMARTLVAGVDDLHLKARPYKKNDKNKVVPLTRGINFSLFILCPWVHLKTNFRTSKSENCPWKLTLRSS